MMSVIFCAEGVDGLSFFRTFDMALDFAGFGGGETVDSDLHFPSQTR